MPRPKVGNQNPPSGDSLNEFLGKRDTNNAPPNRRPGGTERPGAKPDPTQPDGIQRPRLGGSGGATNPPATALPGRNNVGVRAGAGANVNITGGKNTTSNVNNVNNVNNVKVGGGNTTNVNAGVRVNYSDNNQAWVSQRRSWGNDVRTGVGPRFNNVFDDRYFRRGPLVGGYNYYGGWATRGPYYAWTPVTWTAFGAFFGAGFVSAKPVYYAYGQGGNVYYENNLVYVNGQAAGSSQQYYQQVQAQAVAAPPVDQVNQQPLEWLPLGVFALTSEEAGDSQAVVQLAVNKQGVIAGTYYNEASQVSRPIQGMVDLKTQRAAMSFADKKNTDLILETSLNNLTQDEAPALLHFGSEQSQPELLVRLKPPEGAPATSN